MEAPYFLIFFIILIIFGVWVWESPFFFYFFKFFPLFFIILIIFSLFLQK